MSKLRVLVDELASSHGMCMKKLETIFEDLVF